MSYWQLYWWKGWLPEPWRWLHTCDQAAVWRSWHYHNERRRATAWDSPAFNTRLITRSTSYKSANNCKVSSTPATKCHGNRRQLLLLYIIIIILLEHV